MSSAPAAYVAFPIASTSTKKPTVSSSASFIDVPSTNKKKFGKNLSKLIKQPESLVTDSAIPSKNSLSRNGILLLSTKRGGPASSSLASGLLNTKTSAAPKPINTVSLKSESALSVIGNTFTTPVVWQLNNQRVDDTDKGGNIKEEYHDTYGLNDRPTTMSKEDNVDRYSTSTEIFDDGVIIDNSSQTGVQQTANSKQETQEEYMARLARERSEKRKHEEEMRIREQRERAERRLMELDTKRKSLHPSINEPTSSEKVLVDVKSFYTRSGGYDSKDEYVDASMERFSHRTHRSPQMKSINGSWYDDNREMRESTLQQERFKNNHPARSLFDPYRPSTANSGRNFSQTNAKDSHDVALTKGDVNIPERLESAKPDLPGAHVSSYDDTNRGERRNVSSTRMLFDPKSGSMVSVRVRDDADSARPKKEKGKAMKSKASSDKEIDGRSQSKKDELKENKKIKKRLERKGSAKYEKNQNDQSLNAPRLPRTCGVLYRREMDGTIVSVDGCDGDQGPGSHSVPGGRVRNGTGHSECMEQQSTQHYNGDNFERFIEPQFHGKAVKVSPMPENFYGLTDLAASKYAPLTREHFMKNVSSKKADGNDSNANAELPWHLRVKPNEKIELVTGIDESPTLQATAAAWAPSQSTMDAIKNALPRAPTPDAYLESESESSYLDEISESEVPALTLVDLDGAYEEEDVEDDNESPSMIGLGFDPALNMDSVMMSPALSQRDFDPSTSVDCLNLTDSASKHLNAFMEKGTSSQFLTPAWSSSGSLGNLNNWEYMKNSTKSSTADELSVSLNMMSSNSLSSFLPLTLTKGDHGKASSSSHSLLDTW